jgi:hypothetical protein
VREAGFSPDLVTYSNLIQASAHKQLPVSVFLLML